ncbi:MAG: dephospho-CoA kinase [Epsilonproteobacteria bacterium (ex Lamellibrachia satsuma)]|nr:MAG: dephospho-CoA kinase [Epsilonproteobacteria bacterium (ex Lamellibrachia satsuma)]
MAFEYAVALTGSIATGKSTAVDILSRYGFLFIDADKIAHQILDEQQTAIAEMFGMEFIENSRVNRKALGAMVFSDPVKRKELESLLHPFIYDEIERQALIQDAAKEPYIIDIPLFFEGGRYPIERSLVVYTTKEQQLKRLMQRDGYNKEEALKRIGSQIDIDEKRERATYTVDNTGNLAQLQYECEQVKELILGDFK